MKTKFISNDEVYPEATPGIDDHLYPKGFPPDFSFYEDVLKERGFILDKENQECYIILDREVKLNVGDNVIIYNYVKTVRSKYYNVDDDIMEYHIEN